MDYRDKRKDDNYVAARSTKPLRFALIISGIFLVVSMLYLWWSTEWAAEITRSVGDVQRIEFLKGTIFMIVAATGICALSYVFLRRIERQQEQINQTREHLMEVRGRVLAGTLTASVAHDLKNLLAVIEPNLEFADDDETPEAERRECVRDALLAARGLNSLNERLTRVAQHGHDGEPVQSDLVEIARDAISMISSHSKMRNREVNLIAQDATPISLYPDLAVHAIINLLLNAADATAADGKIHLYVRRRRESVEFEVHDDGPGIPDDRKERILEPFETTKDDGTGLGLFIVSHFARMHGGRVELDQSDFGGALVRVVLPRDSEVSLSESDPIFVEQAATV